MSESATAELRADGRLRLHHGPIDVLVSIDAISREHRDQGLRSIVQTFDGLLEALAAELPLLRSPETTSDDVSSPTAMRMVRATNGVSRHAFVTPMAAVAGSVADTLCAAVSPDGVQRVIVNNGGDIALYLDSSAEVTVGLADDRSGHVGPSARVSAATRVRGIATSGRRGRSLSLGIADAVTVFAQSAASADAAATVIASAVDLPGSPLIQRRAASEIDASSDLGEREVVVAVPPLPAELEAASLEPGLELARALHVDGLIIGAALFLGTSHAFTGETFREICDV